MLRVTKVDTFYGNIQALRGISLKVEAGEIVTLLGSNGAGKTTTLKTISGLIAPARGKIEFMGKRADGRSPEKLVRMGISMVPEGRDLFPEMTVLENLEMGAYIRKDKKSIREDMDRVFSYFPILDKRRFQLAGTLSGGEQQMAAIGRGLMSQPKLLMLDEPSLGLAPLIVEEIFRIIGEINLKKTTILLVEQNAELALSISNRGYILENMEIKGGGTTNELMKDKEVQKFYLGTVE
ncbi:MAG: ABC transporter ATP-binding protein [Deltaproteobacteria bacterium RBG_16_50_11]|nr:MAG: ABC transporter ATP-binding protein [Deltaproteobacteria bacterium RBG_16_50_11]